MAEVTADRVVAGDGGAPAATLSALEPRVIPCLQLNGDGLVKTTKFARPGYVGDPVNTVRIFNELEVAELCFLDIRATVEGRAPQLSVLRDIADECFMPLSYGGGVRDVATAKEILAIGFEKVVVNSAACDDPELIARLAERLGSQAVVGSIDVKRNLWGSYHVVSHDGTSRTGKDPVEWAQRLESLGAGELLLCSMDRDGTWEGFDIEITRRVAEAVSVPLIASGGAGTIAHIEATLSQGKASAVALGSMVVYQAKGMGVLVSFPDRTELSQVYGRVRREREHGE